MASLEACWAILFYLYDTVQCHDNVIVKTTRVPHLQKATPVVVDQLQMTMSL